MLKLLAFIFAGLALAQNTGGGQVPKTAPLILTVHNYTLGYMWLRLPL
jgi:hypothetical protein